MLITKASLMLFLRKPYLGLLSTSGLSLRNQTATIRWSTALGGGYRLEGSAGLTSWISLATNLLGTGGQLVQRVTATSSLQFFRLAIEQ